MTRLLKQSTAFTFRIGPFVDSTDGVTAETGLSIGQSNIQLSKAGGAFGQTSASPTTTHDTGGWYQCPLTTTDTNTLGPLTVSIQMTGALPVWEHFLVVPANIYDSWVSGSDVLDVSMTQIAGSAVSTSTAQLGVNLVNIAGAAVSTTTAQLGVNVVQLSADATAADNAEAFFDGTGYAGTNNTIPTVTTVTNLINAPTNGDLTATMKTSVTTAASAATPALSAAGVSAIWDKATSALTTAGSVGKLVVDNVNAPIATVDTVVDAIKVKTDYLPSATAGAAGGVFIAGSNAATSVTTALTANITGNLSGSVGSVTGAVGSVTGAVGSVTGAVGSVTGNVGGNVTGSVGSVTAGVTLADDAITSAKYDESTAFPIKSADTGATQIARVGADSDTLETLSDQIDAISASAIADAVWDEALAGHSGAGSAGLALSGASAPTAAAVADAVWDEAISGHLGAGSTGNALNAAGSAGDPWSTGLPGAYGAGSAGYIVGNNLNASVSSRSSHSAADVWSSGTRTLTASSDPTAGAIADAVWDEARSGHTSAGTFGEGAASVQGNVTGSVGSVTGAVGSVTGAVGSVTGSVGSVTGAVGSVTAGVTVTTNNDKTGYALSVTPPTAVQVRQEMDSNSTQLAAIKTVTDNVAGMYETDGGVKRWTANSLEQAPSGGSAPTAADVADAVWNEAIGDHLTALSTGAALNAAGAAGDPWSTAIPGAYGAGTAGYIVGNGLSGVGSEAVTITIDDGTDPLDGVLVWITTDAGGTNTVANGYTDASGSVTFMLDPATYYVWKQLSGVNFTNPETLVVP